MTPAGARWEGRCGALVALWLLAAPMAAAQARRVLVVVEPTSAGVLARLRRELAGMGLEVVVSDRPDDLRPSSPLGELARRSQGAAVLRLLPGRGRIEVAVTDATTGALVQHEQELQGPEIQRDDGVVALRMVELLRAGLLEVQASAAPSASAAAPSASAPPAPPVAAPSASAPAPPASAPAPAASAPSAFAARAGLSVLSSPGGLGPMLHAKVGGARAVGRGRLTADLLIPVGPARLEAEGGRLSIFTTMLSAGGQVIFASPSTALSGGLGAAVGLLWGSFSAEAAAPYEARRQQTLAVVPQIRGEVSRSAGEGWRLWGEALAGRSLSPLSLRLPGKADIPWGNLIVAGALGVELGF